MSTEPEPESVTVEFTVNGETRRVDIPPRRTLADVLREDLHLTGTHLGCEHGVCGACTVIVDGDPVRSCLMFGVQVSGAEIETVEGLALPDGSLNDLQRSFSEHHGLQCGFCTPGMLMLGTAYVRRAVAADRASVREVVSSNLCRCTGYQGIVDAVCDLVCSGGEATITPDPRGNGEGEALDTPVPAGES